MKKCAGQLRYRITLQKPVNVPDGIGGFTQTWENAASNIWADKRQLFGSEKPYHDAVSLNEILVFTVRRRAEKISPQWQIVYANQRYQITGLSSQELNNPFVEITAQRDPG
jgi:head-tail adaptor